MTGSPRKSRYLPAVAMLAGVVTAGGVAAGERCQDRRIVRFGETTASIAQRCGVTPGAIERQNPGIHIDGAVSGRQINVPRPALPTPRIEIRGNPALSGGNGIQVPRLR